MLLPGEATGVFVQGLDAALALLGLRCKWLLLLLFEMELLLNRPVPPLLPTLWPCPCCGERGRVWFSLWSGSPPQLAVSGFTLCLIIISLGASPFDSWLWFKTEIRTDREFRGKDCFLKSEEEEVTASGWKSDWQWALERETRRLCSGWLSPTSALLLPVIFALSPRILLFTVVDDEVVEWLELGFRVVVDELPEGLATTSKLALEELVLALFVRGCIGKSKPVGIFSHNGLS